MFVQAYLYGSRVLEPPRSTGWNTYHECHKEQVALQGLRTDLNDPADRVHPEFC